LGELSRLDLSHFKTALTNTVPASALVLALIAHEILDEKNTSFQKSLKRLDFLFHEFKASSVAFADPLEGISALNNYMFRDKNFQGIRFPVNNPEQIFVSKVIENRVGSPLSLSLIYRELARRIHSAPVDLINFPGHYLIKVLYQHQLLFLDPSEQGKLLSVAELQKKLTKRFGKNIVLNSSYLETPTENQLVVRFLTKLKNIYFEQRDWVRLLAVLDMILWCDPQRLLEYKERGLLFYQFGMAEQAYGDIQSFVERSKPSEEIDKLRNLVTHLQNPDITPIY
jgi:regulator of sirC expression with transglutaminase-like and TPR domain